MPFQSTLATMSPVFGCTTTTPPLLVRPVAAYGKTKTPVCPVGGAGNVGVPSETPLRTPLRVRSNHTRTLPGVNCPTVEAKTLLTPIATASLPRSE
ncbi:MAG: hypothetical protein IPL76_03215 [Gemmatimonadetes bacterium]|nr:hypothetical protein [Gemmatimonadota bacterium]